MKIFITGASGFIGSAVALAFARAGHEVHGLVRSAHRAGRLLPHEVLAVIGSLDEPGSYAQAARACQVLIHCAADYSPRGWDVDRSTIEGLLRSAAESGTERCVIYTSGVWLYGDTGAGVADESSPAAPLPFSVPRAATEQAVLKAPCGSLRTLVLRPGCVYGGAGSLTAGWFDSAAQQGAARVIGDGSARWAMVHREDLAELYLRAAESGLGGIFNATDRSRFTVMECARAASHAAGAGGKVTCVAVEDAVRQMGPYAACMALSQHVDSGKAVRLLGWQPRHGGFVDGIARYYAAWKAQAQAAQ